MDYPIYRSAYTAAQIEAAIGKGPIIIDGYWAVWDITASAYVNTGVQAEGESMISAMRDTSEGNGIIISAVDDNGTPTNLASARIAKYVLFSDSAQDIFEQASAAYAVGTPCYLLDESGVPFPLLNLDQGVELVFAGFSSWNAIRTYYVGIDTVDDSYYKEQYDEPIPQPVLSTLTVSGVWTGENPYYAAASVSASISPNSKIDVQLSADQIITLQAAGVTALLVENDYPSIRVCAIGGYPIGSLSLQCTVTEVHG